MKHEILTCDKCRKEYRPDNGPTRFYTTAIIRSNLDIREDALTQDWAFEVEMLGPRDIPEKDRKRRVIDICPECKKKINAGETLPTIPHNDQD